MTIKLRPCKFTDIDILIDLSRRSYHQHYTYLWEDHGVGYMNQQFSRKAFEEQLADDGSEWYLIETDDTPMGVLKINNDRGFGKFPDDSAMEVERIYLLRQHTGKGHGGRIMQFVEKLARLKGKSILWLKVMDSSPVISFYEKCGFEKYGRSSLNLEKIKPHLKGMIIMVLFLPK